MTHINRRPHIWFYRGAWRCAVRTRDEIGVGPSPSQAYDRWWAAVRGAWLQFSASTS